MSVITISRERGSDGDSVAAQVAASLGFHLVDKTFLATVLSQYGLVEFDQEYANLPGFWDLFNAQKAETRETMARMLSKVMHALAWHGNVVILGRVGFAALADVPEVLHVRLQAPLAERIVRLARRDNIPTDKAEDLIKASDAARSTFANDFYGVHWDAADSFDLVINTAKTPPDLACRWIVEAAKSARAGLAEPNTGVLEPDSVLAQTIAERLSCGEKHV